MLEFDNPYAPGAGNQPPELAGRAHILSRAEMSIRRLQAGRHEKGQLLLGLRGVGKTVLLNKVEQIAEESGAETIFVEAPEGRRLAEQLLPALRKTIIRLDRVEAARAHARGAVRAIRNFASVFKLTLGELEMSVSPEAGTADSGDLASDLTDVILAVARAAGAGGKVITLLVDEVQYLTPDELGALIVAAHKASQRQVPYLFVGAGLPQLAGLAGDARSYAERLFDYPDVGPLKPEDAIEALSQPAARAGATFTNDALSKIVDITQGYPYFLQEWGYHAWNAAPSPTIDLETAIEATKRAIARLDGGFFRVRFDRLTPREKEYMRGMAELGPGPHRSGDIARALKNEVRQVAPLRSGLIRKGMLYSPAHGDTAFTVPMFDEFLKRTMP